MNQSSAKNGVDTGLLGSLQRPLALARPWGVPWLNEALDRSAAAEGVLPLVADWRRRWAHSLAYSDTDVPLVHASWASSEETFEKWKSTNAKLVFAQFELIVKCLHRGFSVFFFDHERYVKLRRTLSNHANVHSASGLRGKDS